MNTFAGTGVALITPFNDKKQIDFKALERMVNHVIADGKGVDYIVVLGTTGETATLNTSEKNEIFDAVRQFNNKRVPLVAGFGSNNTEQLIKDIQSFNSSGYSALLSASPYYNKPSQEGIYQHYKAVCGSTKLPVILYNVPGRTSSNIQAATCIRMATDFKNVIAMKEASGDIVQCMEIVKDRPKKFLVLSGEDALTLPMMSFGMDGVISVAANVWPIEFSNMVRLCQAQKFEEASKIHYKLLTGIHLLFAEGNPAGAKAFLAHKKLIKNVLRLPLVPVSDMVEKKIKAFK